MADGNTEVKVIIMMMINRNNDIIKPALFALPSVTQISACWDAAYNSLTSWVVG